MVGQSFLWVLHQHAGEANLSDDLTLFVALNERGIFLPLDFLVSFEFFLG